MGRLKMKIKRLERLKDRQIKYSKRRIGLLKKAKELATLCDVDLALIMYSPAGKPTVHVSQNRELESVVERLSKVAIADREERRDYTLKLLNKMHTDIDVDIKNLSLDKSQFLKLKKEEAKDMKDKMDNKAKIINEWNNPHMINDLAKITIMYDHLALSLNTVKVKKGNLIIQEMLQQANGQTFEDDENVPSVSELLGYLPD